MIPGGPFLRYKAVKRAQRLRECTFDGQRDNQAGMLFPCSIVIAEPRRIAYMAGCMTGSGEGFLRKIFFVREEIMLDSAFLL